MIEHVPGDSDQSVKYRMGRNTICDYGKWRRHHHFAMIVSAFGVTEGCLSAQSHE